MPGPVQLTPDALESLLVDLDDGEFAAFVADLYERTGHDTGREGSVITTIAPGGDRERLLVWTDGRTRIERLFGTDPPDPDMEGIDAVVTRGRDAATAAAIAEEAGADLLETIDLHDRLLYAMDRETCRDLCQVHFNRSVEPRPASEDDSENAPFSVPSRSQTALAGVVVCGLLVVVVAGVPGGTSGGIPAIPGERSGVAGPTASGPVTPVYSGDTATPTLTPDEPTQLPPGADEADPGITMLEPCPNEEGATVICIPPRPVSVSHYPDIFAGSRTGSLYATFENSYDTEMVNASLRIEPPPNWQSQAANGPLFYASTDELLLANSLAPGESESVAWVVTPPEFATGGRYNVTVIWEWEVPGYDGAGSTDENRFRVQETITYRVRPSECRVVEPCSLLANDTAKSEPLNITEARAGSTNETTGFLYNPHDSPIRNGTITLEPPTKLWEITVNGTSLSTGVDIGSLNPGESRSISLRLTVPKSVQCGARTYVLRGTTTYELDGDGQVTVPFAVEVSPERGGGGCFVN
ncbi:MAG: NEW3 domain-containing protein [Halobacteriales archaeon]